VGSQRITMWGERGGEGSGKKIGGGGGVGTNFRIQVIEAARKRVKVLYANDENEQKKRRVPLREDQRIKKKKPRALPWPTRYKYCVIVAILGGGGKICQKRKGKRKTTNGKERGGGPNDSGLKTQQEKKLFKYVQLEKRGECIQGKGEKCSESR